MKDILLNEVSQREKDKYSISLICGISKSKTRKQSIMVVSRGWRKWGDVAQRVQTFSYKTIKFRRSNVQHGSIKFAKRADLKCSYHNTKGEYVR